MRFYKLDMDSAGVQHRWHVMKNISMLLAVSFALRAQTTINGGRIFKGTLDASGAASTLPHRTGTGSPAGRDACARAGETYFQLDGTGGQNVWACTAAGTPGTWTAASGGLADTGSNGLVVRTASGTTTPRALTAGTGMICVNGDGVAGNPTCSPDTAIILSRSTAQSGADTTCKPANMSATAPTCSLATALLTYTAGAPLQFCPDTTAGTAPVLNVNGLGPLTFKKLAGSSLVNLAAGDYVAGACYGLILGAGTPPTFVILEPADKIISAQGDLITGDANGVPTKLAIGGNLTVLTSNGTSASWASAAGAVSSVNSMTGAVSLSDLNTSGQVTAAHFAAPLPVAQGGTGVATSTGTGNTVRSTSPTLVTPALGTPASGVMTNVTGLPLTTGVTGVLPVANGGTGVTTSTGTGNTVLSASPTLVTPALGTPASGVMTNVTGLPLTTGVTGVLPVANGGMALPDTASRLFEYLMQEQTGTTLGDTSGNANTCTFGASAAAPAWVRTQSIAGVQFAGSQRCVMTTSVWSTAHTWFFALRPNAIADRTSVSQGFNVVAWGDTANQAFYIPAIHGSWSGYRSGRNPFGGPRLTGNVIVAATWTGTTLKLYINGAEIGYVYNTAVSQTASTNTYLGDGISLGSNWGFRGVMAYAAGYSTTYTAAQVAANTGKIALLLESEGMNWQVQQQHPRHCLFDGDSLTDNSANGPYWNSSYERYVLDLLPFTCDASNLGNSGETFSTMQSQAASVIDPIISVYDADLTLCSVLAGTNDLAGAVSGAALYTSYAAPYESGRRTAGCKNVLVTVTPNGNLSSGQKTERLNYNSTVRTNWLSGSLQADAIADIGADPNIGLDGDDANTGFYNTGNLHPKDLGNRMIATYLAPALVRAAGASEHVCFVLTVGVNVGTTKWTMDVNHSGAPADILTLAAALTQDVPLYYVGAKYRISSTRVTTTTAFTGTATLTTSIGDSVGGATFYDATNFNLQAAAASGNYHDASANAGASSAGSYLQLHIVSTTNNLASIGAGAVDVTVCVSNIP